MNNTNITEQFIDYLYNLSNERFPEHVVLQAKRCLLDYLGVTLAGAKMLQNKGNKLLDYLVELPGNTTVIGFHRKSDIEKACFMNGLSSHIAELDDGLNSGIVHLGSPVISALLPVAENIKITGTGLLAGIITGYETTARIACAIQPYHKKRGYHATGTCGTIGAAIAIAAMWGFSKKQMKNAFSAAVISASGTLKVLENNSELKPFNTGRAALNGRIAALMAKAGFEGPEDVLSGDTGFLSMMAEKFDLSHLYNQEANFFKIEKGYVKPYAACRYCHPAIEAALKVKSNHFLEPKNIKEVNISTYHWAVANHDHADITGISSAKMSIPYSVAVSLLAGKAGIEEFSNDYINNPEVVSLTQKVSVHSNDQLTAYFPERCIAVITIITYGGDRYSERVDFPKGEPENPMSEEELEEKFITLATYGGKNIEQCNKIIRIVKDLDNKLEQLFPLLQA
jgi:2-methylcitrate dehydratase PrpD